MSMLIYSVSEYFMGPETEFESWHGQILQFNPLPRATKINQSLRAKNSIFLCIHCLYAFCSNMSYLEDAANIPASVWYMRVAGVLVPSWIFMEIVRWARIKIQFLSVFSVIICLWAKYIKITSGLRLFIYFMS